MSSKYASLIIILFIGLLTFALTNRVYANDAFKPKIVTTTTDLADITKRITGDAAIVNSIASGNEDPHFLTARPSYIIQARDADAWIRVGLELEIGWEGPILRDSRNLRIQVGEPAHMDASENVIIHDIPKQRITRDMGDVHPYGNPHYWLDPLNGRIVAKTITAHLIKLFPKYKDAFQKNLKIFENNLDQKMFGENLVQKYGGARLWKMFLEKVLIQTLKKDGALPDLKGWLHRLLPFQGKSIVTYHRSWIYLTKRFGLKTPIELEPKPGVPPGSRHLNQVIKTIKDQQIRVILQEPFYSEKAADFVAQKTGEKVIICPNTVGGNENAKSYLELLDNVIVNLAQALEDP